MAQLESQWASLIGSKCGSLPPLTCTLPPGWCPLPRNPPWATRAAVSESASTSPLAPRLLTLAAQIAVITNDGKHYVVRTPR